MSASSRPTPPRRSIPGLLQGVWSAIMSKTHSRFRSDAPSVNQIKSIWSYQSHQLLIIILGHLGHWTACVGRKMSLRHCRGWRSSFALQQSLWVWHFHIPTLFLSYSALLPSFLPRWICVSIWTILSFSEKDQINSFWILDCGRQRWNLMSNVFPGLGSTLVNGLGSAAQPRIHSKHGEAYPNGYFDECVVADW